jgi:hypothetical protein
LIIVALLLLPLAGASGQVPAAGSIAALGVSSRHRNLVIHLSALAGGGEQGVQERSADGG